MADFSTWLAGITLPSPAPGWTDRSMLAFAGPAPEGGLPPSVTLTRDERKSAADPVGETFDAYVQRQMQVLQGNLPGFHGLRQGPLAGGSAEVRELLFDWRSGAVGLTQWVVWLAVTDGSVLTFAATCASAGFDAQRPVFEGALRSLRVAPPEPPGAR